MTLFRRWVPDPFLSCAFARGSLPTHHEATRTNVACRAMLRNYFADEFRNFAPFNEIPWLSCRQWAFSGLNKVG